MNSVSTASTFILMPFKEEYDDVYLTIKNTAKSVASEFGTSYECYRADEIAAPGRITHSILNAITNADLIIADITGNNPNVMYELGFAQSAGKPIVLICQNAIQIPFDVADWRVIVYDRGRLLRDLQPQLAAAFRHYAKPKQGTKNSDPSSSSNNFSEQPNPRQQVFISYSHSDLDVLKRIQVHLKPLERHAQIDLWVDSKIKAGEKWEKSIELALSRAKIAILLISADFLASDFIANNELPPLLQAAEREGVKILPLIVKPSRFLRDKNLSAFQALNDPSRPVMKMPEVEQEELFSRLAEIVEYYHA